MKTSRKFFLRRFWLVFMSFLKTTGEEVQPLSSPMVRRIVSCLGQEAACAGGLAKSRDKRTHPPSPRAETSGLGKRKAQLAARCVRPLD
jgi:hypothetical protein